MLIDTLKLWGVGNMIRYMTLRSNKIIYKGDHMVFKRNQKINKTFIGCCVLIVLISLLELYLAHMIRIAYVDVYKINHILIVIFQPIFFTLLFRKKVTHIPLRIAILIVCLIMIPLATYITLPRYTYNEGKQQVAIYVNLNKTLEFDDISPKRVVAKTKDGFNEIYYYTVTMNGTKRYFVVEPKDGEVHEWSDPAY